MVQQIDHRITLACRKTLLQLLGFRKSSQIFFYSAVINTEKLICSGSHVDIIRFSFRAFLVHEAIDGISSRRCFNEAVQNEICHLHDITKM